MPLDKSGSYRPSPAHAAMHDGPAPDPAQQDAGKGHVELHDSGSGSYKTVHHSPDGQVEEREHASLHDAHQAMNEHMGADGCSGGEDGSEDDDGENNSDEDY